MLDEDVIVRTPKACLIWISMDDGLQSSRSGTVCYLGYGKADEPACTLKGLCCVVLFQQERNNSSPTQHVLKGLTHAVKK